MNEIEALLITILIVENCILTAITWNHYRDKKIENKKTQKYEFDPCLAKTILNEKFTEIGNMEEIGDIILLQRYTNNGIIISTNTKNWKSELLTFCLNEFNVESLKRIPNTKDIFEITERK